MKKVLINVEERELRVAMLEDDQLVELYIESLDEKSILNNIYKGRVEDVLPGLKAAFVNIGIDRNAFLHFDDVRPDLIWGKYRELNPELADEVPTAREALAEGSLDSEGDGDTEDADGKRKRRRGRRGGKKRRPDAEDTYSPGLPVGVTEDDLEDDDEDDTDTHPVAATPATDTYTQVDSRQQRYAETRQVPQRDNNEQAIDTESAPAQSNQVAAVPEAAPAGENQSTGSAEEEIERRRIARIEKQRQRRDRWEQKKQERQQRRQQERLERAAQGVQLATGESASVPTPAPAPYVAPEPVAPAAYGTRGAAHSTDSYANFTVGGQRRNAKQRFADQARYGDNFGNIAIRKNERVDHRESQVDFFGPSVQTQGEEHSIWDDRQPNLGPVPVGRPSFGNENRRSNNRSNDRYSSDRRPGSNQKQGQGQGQSQNKNRKYNKDNKRRGGKKRTSMRKRDDRSYFAFSADDIVDNDNTSEINSAEVTPVEKKPVRRKKAAADTGEITEKKTAAKKPAARKPAARKKKSDDAPETKASESAINEKPTVSSEQTDVFEATEAPKKTRPARKPAARKTSAAAKAESAPVAAENTTEPQVAAPAPVPPSSAETSAPQATEQPASTQPAASDPNSSNQANQQLTTPTDSPAGEPQKRIRETRAQRFARIRRERAAAKAEARAASSETKSEPPAESAADIAPPAEKPAEGQPRDERRDRDNRPPRRDRNSRRDRNDRGRRDRDQNNASTNGAPTESQDTPTASDRGTVTIVEDKPAYTPANRQQSQSQQRDNRSRMRRPQFQEVFKKGDQIMVQVVKEEIGMKGARISSYVSLPGRYLVLLPYPNQEGGISRKVEDIKERKRLKNLLQDISSDETAFIIRTAGVFQEEAEIRKDVEFLSGEWATIAERYKQADASALVYDDHDILYRLARDVFDDSVGEIVIDSFTEFEKLKGILSKLIPNLVDKVKLYSGAENLFHKSGVTKQIQKAARRKVWLKSGGYLIIDEAEALTAIDVNTGKSVGKDDQEKLILRTNIESARAVARELKLRDIGGLIVIDFIDMKDPRNREQVLHELKLQLRKDRSKTSVSAISEFGLVEMTRKRVRRSLRKTLFMDCPYCQGAGVVLNEQQIWLHIKHELVRQLESQRPAPSINVTVNPRIRAYVDQNYKDVIRRLEQKYDTEIRISMSDIFHIENYQIDKADTVGVISGSATMPSR